MSYTLADLAVKFGCELHGDPETKVNSIATLSSASAGDISFFTNKKYKQQLQDTRASAVIMRSDAVELCNTKCILLQY